MPCEFRSPRDLQGLEIFNNWAHVSVNVPGLLPVEHNTQTTPHLLHYKSISGSMIQNFTPFKEEKCWKLREILLRVRRELQKSGNMHCGSLLSEMKRNPS